MLGADRDIDGPERTAGGPDRDGGRDGPATWGVDRDIRGLSRGVGETDRDGGTLRTLDRGAERLVGGLIRIDPLLRGGAEGRVRLTAAGERLDDMPGPRLIVARLDGRLERDDMARWRAASALARALAADARARALAADARARLAAACPRDDGLGGFPSTDWGNKITTIAASAGRIDRATVAPDFPNGTEWLMGLLPL
jgi:hypothetical protein